MGQICRKSDYTDQKKNYTQLVKKLGYDGEVLLVGINYSTKTKKHSCVIKNFR